MTKSPITLQELRRRIYVKAKAEKSWRFLRQGFGWKRWSRRWMYGTVGLFTDYRVRYLVDSPKDAALCAYDDETPGLVEIRL